MNPKKTPLKNSFLQSGRRIGAATAALALVMIAEVCFAAAGAGQQPSVILSSQQTANPAIPQATPESTPSTGAQQPAQPANGTPTVSTPPTPPLPAPTSTGPGFVFPQLNDREIVVTAVGDVMLGTTFPDETGGLLPPNDGADLLQ
ncbi:MAG TPA: hypothetical protein VJV96_00195, partial [Candidatus Angelobacter sp.]|nr:hypothetical protein [Candidatus Angelobacter sp.]